MFLLICGLKIWLKEAGPIGDLLYELGLLQGIQTQIPISASTLGNVVDVLLAYTPCLTDAALKHMEIINSRVHGLCDSSIPRKVYHVQSAEFVAKMISTVFQQYTDQDISYVVLKGSVSAMWVITLFTWLLPDDIGMIFKGELICGRGDAKVTMELQEYGQETGHWSLQTWTASAMNKVISLHAHGSLPLQELPWRITRQFIQAEYEFSDKMLSITGQLSTYLIKIFIEMGGVQNSSHDGYTLLEALVGTDTLNRYESIATEFGWKETPDKNFQAALEKRSQNFRGLDSDALPVRGYPERLRNEIKAAIYEAFPSFIDELWTDLTKQEDLLNLAIMVTTSALGHLMAQRSGNKNGTTTYIPYIHLATYKEREHMIELLLSTRGIEYRRFRRTLYSCILSSIDTEEALDDALVIERDGLLLYPKIILDEEEIERSSAFEFCIRPGVIKTESAQRYKFVRELSQRDPKDPLISMSSKLESVKAFSGSDYIGIKPRTDWMAQPPEFLAYISIQGDSLLIRSILRVFPAASTTTQSAFRALNPFATRTAPQQLDISPPWVDWRFQYRDVLETLATAFFVPKSSFSIHAESSLAKKYRNVLDSTLWLYPGSPQRGTVPENFGDNSLDYRFIVYTGSNKGLTLFQLSNGTDLHSKTVLMERGCNLMQAIHAAEQAKPGSWLVIMCGT